jgi:hypothetical protein
VGEGADVDIGDVPLTPLPLQFLDLQPCTSIVPPRGERGARCTYRVRVRNRTPQRFIGAAWSTIQAFDTGSPLGFTNFQVGDPKTLTLDPGESEFVRFTVRIPGTVAVGALVCPQIFTGTNSRYPYFNSTGQVSSFCVFKDASGLSVITGQEARQRRDDMLRRQQQPAVARPQSVLRNSK